MNNFFSRKISAIGDNRLACGASAYFDAFLQNSFSGCAMNSAVNTSSASQSRIGGIDNRLNVFLGNVPLLYRNFTHDIFSETSLKNSSISDCTESAILRLGKSTGSRLTTIIFPSVKVGIIAAGCTTHEVPMTKNKSDSPAKSNASFRYLTFSPKKTTSGLI